MFQKSDTMNKAFFTVALMMWPFYDQVSWSVSVFNLTQTRVTGKYEPYMGTVFIALD